MRTVDRRRRRSVGSRRSRPRRGRLVPRNGLAVRSRHARPRRAAGGGGSWNGGLPGDRDQRHAKRKTPPALQPEERHETIVERQLHGRKRRTPQQSTVEIPAEDSEEIKEPAPLDLEPGARELVEELGAAVATKMVESTVERAVERP